MSRSINSLKDVVDWGLCTGCGACHYACDRNAVSLFDVESVGIRPKFEAECETCNRCLSICPGYVVDAGLIGNGTAPAGPTDHEFGPALEVWEGFAADPEIRHRASSGGLLTALSLHCLEREGMTSVLHTGAVEGKPWLNQTVMSRNRDDLLRRTGSRYAPASPCDGLQAIEESEGPCVFIGKPCDTAAVLALRRERPGLDRNLGLVLSFFCAGTPSTQGTQALLQHLGLERDRVDRLRYRGEGWPGRFKAGVAGDGEERSLSYEESWGRLTKFRPMRCNLCPDGLGRLADLTCGDAWHRRNGSEDPGLSLVLVRTPRGRDILHRAMEAGVVELERVSPTVVLEAQSNLLERRRHLYGRFLGMRMLGVPIPRFVGFSLRSDWAKLGLIARLRDVLGTMKRIVRRGLWKRNPMTQASACDAGEKSTGA